MTALSALYNPALFPCCTQMAAAVHMSAQLSSQWCIDKALSVLQFICACLCARVLKSLLKTGDYLHLPGLKARPLRRLLIDSTAIQHAAR